MCSVALISSGCLTRPCRNNVQRNPAFDYLTLNAADTVSLLTPHARAISARLRYRPSASHRAHSSARCSRGTSSAGSTSQTSRRDRTRTTSRIYLPLVPASPPFFSESVQVKDVLADPCVTRDTARTHPVLTRRPGQPGAAGGPARRSDISDPPDLAFRSARSRPPARRPALLLGQRPTGAARGAPPHRDPDARRTQHQPLAAAPRPSTRPGIMDRPASARAGDLRPLGRTSLREARVAVYRA